MRYGLDDGEEKTLEEVGKAFNVSGWAGIVLLVERPVPSWVGWKLDGDEMLEEVGQAFAVCSAISGAKR